MVLQNVLQMNALVLEYIYITASIITDNTVADKGWILFANVNVGIEAFLIVDIFTLQCKVDQCQ